MFFILFRGSFHHSTLTGFKGYNFAHHGISIRTLSQTQCACFGKQKPSLESNPLVQRRYKHLKPLVSLQFSTLPSNSKHPLNFHVNSGKLLFCIDKQLCQSSKNANLALASYCSVTTEQTHIEKKGNDKLKIKELSESDLEKDALDVNSLLHDIQKDFNDVKSTVEQSLPDENKSEKKSSELNQNTLATEFQYDYRVAEDIEEYEYKDEREMAQQMIRPEKVLPISLERGQSGVFDLEELLVFLQHLGAENIVTIPIPFEANFCDHMVIASAKSKRHLSAMNEEFLWVHKRKKMNSDATLNIEGLGKSDWAALDLGNIVLHIFYGEAREHYDIESLWTLGPELDPKCKQQNEDLSALSAESLFWLETSRKTEAEKPENLQEIEATKKTKT